MTIKEDCYIFWDGEEVPEEDKAIHLQCKKCFESNQKGFRWSKDLLYGKNEIKCSLCDAIIYKREKKKKNNDDKTSI